MTRRYLLTKTGGGRIDWIDISKGIFMFFVIMSHTGYVPSFLISFYTPFYLSGFFLVSGYFFITIDKEFSYKQKFLNILTTIFASQLLYVTITYFAVHLLTKDICLGDYLIQIMEGKKLWFISCLFISEIMGLIYFIIFSVKRITIYLFPVISLSFFLLIPYGEYPWSFNIAFLANFYLGIGIVLRLHSQEFLRTLEAKRYGAFSLMIFMALYIFDLKFDILKGTFNSSISNLPFFIVSSFFSIYFILFISKRIVVFNPLVFVGENSLQYYFYQYRIVKYLHAIGSKMGYVSDNGIMACVSTFITCVVLVIPILFVNRYIPVLAGRWKLKIVT